MGEWPAVAEGEDANREDGTGERVEEGSFLIVTGGASDVYELSGDPNEITGGGLEGEGGLRVSRRGEGSDEYEYGSAERDCYIQANMKASVISC